MIYEINELINDVKNKNNCDVVIIATKSWLEKLPKARIEERNPESGKRTGFFNGTDVIMLPPELFPENFSVVVPKGESDPMNRAV